MVKKYCLDGIVVATDWYGNTGYSHVIIHTNEEGLKEIKKDPLQDYISFGVQSVNYVLFDVYLEEVEHTDEYTLKKSYNDPIETIEAGDPTWVNKQSEDFIIGALNTEPAIVNY